MPDALAPASVPVIVAHRGWWRSQGFVENSARAFAAARAAGFEVECDVWPSADGQPVVIHDRTLDRTTGSRGEVAGHRADELRHIRLREPEADAMLPLLADVAHLVSYVEVKATDSPQFVRRVIEIMGARPWLMQSFDARTLVYALEANPRLPIALLVEDRAAFQVALERGWAVYADHAVLDEAVVGQLREQGLRVGAWTVNAEGDIHRVLRLGADVVISDEPMAVRELARVKRQ